MRARRRILLAMDINLAGERRVGIAEYAHSAGWILESRLHTFMQANQHKEYLASIKFDGILAIVRRTGPDFRMIVETAGVPVVDLGQYEYPDFVLPRVFPDNRAAGRLAAEHLLDLGLKRLLFYSHTVDNPFSGMRRDGFREAASMHGIDVKEIWWDSGTPVPPGTTRVDWLADLLKNFERPLGVMAGNDMVASDVLDAADRAGLRVPEDVAVVGVDNDAIVARLSSVPLSSVDLGRERVGYEAAALLDRMMDGEQAPSEPILVAPAGVVSRRSTEMLALSDPDVIKAVRFIQSHFREPITVADVAASTCLSRRHLQDRFQLSLGHGMNDEIARQRLEFSKSMLIQTTHKISTIAVMAGFGGMNRMCISFRKKLGTTPNDYRLAYQPPSAPSE